MARIKRIRKRVKSVVLGYCPVVKETLDGTNVTCGRPLIYAFEVRLCECVECRGLRRWQRYHRNPDAFAYKAKASKARMMELQNKQARRVQAVTI